MKHWIQAARLRTLPLSISGIVVGSFIAFSKGKFDWIIFILALLTTVCFQVLSNFANDYGDGVKGTDNENRVGPQRALQAGLISPVKMLKAVYGIAILSLLIAGSLIYVAFGSDNFGYSMLFFLLGIASVVAAIKYTMGKKAYGYSGLGDLFVLLFFGLLSVLGSEFLYTLQLDVLSVLPALSIGCFSVAVLNLNNLRDRASDVLAHKNTLIVQIGIEAGKKYHYGLLIIGMIMILIYNLLQENAISRYLDVLIFPIFIKNIITVYQNKNPKELDSQLKVVALGTFFFAVFFAIGVVL